VKRTLIWVVAALLSAAAAQASTVISCSESAMVTNTCSAAHITDFNAVLQWNALGTASPVPFTNPATAVASGVQVTVSDSGGKMILADNYALLSNGLGGWIDPTALPNAPFHFSGRFDSKPDATAGSPGDHLVGVYQNNNSMMLAFSQGLNEFAFRISSNSLMPLFNVTISEYASSDGTGVPLGTTTLASLTGGGNCPGLFAVPPVPCNDAPWVVGSGFNATQVHSIIVHTNDPSGFFIDGLFMQTVPEPATTALIGLGLVALSLIARQRQKRA
jgi:hypothetical protein